MGKGSGWATKREIVTFEHLRAESVCSTDSGLPFKNKSPFEGPMMLSCPGAGGNVQGQVGWQDPCG